MGEIDRIQPVLRPILGLKPTDRVHPESDRHHQPQHNRDELDLSNTAPPKEEPEDEEAAESADHGNLSGGLDISI